ncbi:DMT family transporter [Azonexus sp.]|uniref:DMT family transporter n=1 Tax=Azonexus sp. TaxID=1872668 RepID=UPI0027B967BE|nr:DMT family transporter [Azonexus sp.]
MPFHPTALAFVALYGAGFVGARLGLPHAPPFAFLALRFAIAASLLAILAKLFAAPWPSQVREYRHIANAGFLTVGVFSAGVFYSIALGLAPAASALIIALQPILIAVAAPSLLGECIGQHRWPGLLLGLAGVFLVLREGIGEQATTMLPVMLSVVALLGLSAGNLYQKSRCKTMHPFSGGAIQCAVCAAACLIASLFSEDMPITWTGEFVVALLWMAVVVSVGAVSLLVILIRDGEVSRVAGLFYLVPVSAAICAWLLFDQQIGPAQWLGIGIAACGVALANRR